MERSMRGSDFIFDCVHYKCHKTNFKWVRSYIDSPDSIKIKNATMNPINKKIKNCFQYAVKTVLNYEEIKKYL